MLNETIERMQEPTPPFFKKLMRIAAGIGAAGLCIIGLPVTFPAIVLPAAIITAGSYMAAVGTVAAFVAKTTSTQR